MENLDELDKNYVKFLRKILKIEKFINKIQR